MTSFAELPKGQQIWEKMTTAERDAIVAEVGGSYRTAEIARTLRKAMAHIEANADDFATVEARETPDGYWNEKA